MSSVQILDRLGSAAFTIAVVALLLLFVPRLVRADTGRMDEPERFGKNFLAACVESGAVAVSVSGSACHSG